MTWQVIYHPDVVSDLAELGQAEARAVLKVITRRIMNGEPDKIGKPLTRLLMGCRRIRTGSARIVYRVNAQTIEVLIIAVGPRRNAEVYESAEKRICEPGWK
jgi:mRNA interferase RelE/StbE